MSATIAESVCTAPCTAPTVRPVTVEWWAEHRRGDAIAAWYELEQRLGGLPIMCSAEWTDVWLNHFGDQVQHRFAVGRAGDRRIIGLLLLTRGVRDYDGLFRLQTWHMGTAGERDADSACVEYNALACEPDQRAAFFAAVFNQLQDLADWDELRCDGYSAHDAPDMPEAEGWVQIHRSARWIDLDRVRRSGRELITFLGDSTRKSIRQNLRDYGPISVDTSDHPTSAHSIFEDLIRLHQARWTGEGQPGCYASVPFTAFHRELIERMCVDGRLVLLRVRAGEQILGCTQFFVDRGRLLNYQGGRIANDRRHSPGLITDYAGMQYALDRGYTAYDFMAGDSIHKQRLTTDTTPLIWATYRRRRWKFAVMRQLRQAKWWLNAARSEGTTP